MYDTAIIGTGAAGVSAALTLRALKKNFILIGDKNLSVKLRKAEDIANYPGLAHVSGEELARAFAEQLAKEGIEVCGGKVNGVYPADGAFNILCGGEVYEARTVILATGVQTYKPVKGEERLLGKGVSYCAVCDGFLYRGKTIAVIVEGEEELAEVELLAKYAATVRVFSLKRGLKIDLPNVTTVEGVVTEITGEDRVNGVVCNGESYAADGVFVLKQSVAADVLLPGLKTQNGHVIADRTGATGIAGVYAAGDVTGRPYQYAKAVGEGNVCAHSVAEYLK